MKTHELARALATLSRILKSGQNTELKDWAGPAKKQSGETLAGAKIDLADIGTVINIMAEVSRLSKGDYRTIIEAMKLPISILRSDSVRDLQGRFFNYLRDNPDDVRRIREEGEKKGPKGSPELARVLSVLLGGGLDENATSGNVDDKGKKDTDKE